MPFLRSINVKTTEQQHAAPALSVRRLNREDAARLAHLFQVIAGDASARLFHPHPFNGEYADKIVRHDGKDMYLGIFDHAQLVGYAMLRGWDAGYQVPSLGIYLVPSVRGKNLGRGVMAALHRHAREAGAHRVRLKVYAENGAALRLYESLGYLFSTDEAGQRVGHLDLPDNEEINI